MSHERTDPYRALFLMHNYNDVDHMTPVIDTLMRTGKWSCTVVLYPAATLGSISFGSDWRMAHIRETYGVVSELIEAAAPATRTAIRLFAVRNTLTALCDKTPKIGRAFGRDLRGLLPWFLAWRAFDHVLSFWLRRISCSGRQLVARFRPDVIAIDWGQSHNVISPLLETARVEGIPVLQLPHGAWTYEGIYSHASQFDPAKLMKFSRARLPVTQPDAIVVDNLYKGYRSEAQGMARERMRFLGLARFTPQWLECLASLPKGTAALPDTGKPKLVWFPTWLMACDIDAIDATLAVLERYTDRLDIVLKVHTRNPAHEMADYGRRLPHGSKIKLVANEEESFAVTRWANFVLITQSSIIYDAFMLGKPVLYLKYTHEFDCMWEIDGVGEAINNPAALDAKLRQIIAGHNEPSYDTAAVDRYLRLGVTGGLAPETVLDAYIELFVQAAKREPLQAGNDFDTVLDQWRSEGRKIVLSPSPGERGKDTVKEMGEAA